MQKSLQTLLSLMILVASLANIARAQTENATIYPTAILPFQERGSGVKGFGNKISDLLFARLAAREHIYLVDRGHIDTILRELELNVSGIVGPGQATQVGQLTGAKILITGSVVEADTSLYLVAKIIGTETSRVLGASAQGRTSDALPPLIETLSDAVARTISGRSEELVAKTVTLEDRIAALERSLGDARKPTVAIEIEERHIGASSIDAASATEMAYFCNETGFTVIDTKSAGTKAADILIRGEGFSEFSTRTQRLTSVKARLEVEAVDRRTNTLIASERQTAVVVDLSEQLAGKQALQEAAAAIAERLLPKLVR